jgi:hypothetical protein
MDFDRLARDELGGEKRQRAVDALREAHDDLMPSTQLTPPSRKAVVERAKRRLERRSQRKGGRSGGFA